MGIAKPTAKQLVGKVLEWCGFAVFAYFAPIIGSRLGRKQALPAWGWRLPFICGLVIGIGGPWMRRGLDETPQCAEPAQAGGVSKSPVRQVITTMPKAIARVVGLVALMAGAFHTLFVCWPRSALPCSRWAPAHAGGDGGDVPHRPARLRDGAGLQTWPRP